MSLGCGEDPLIGATRVGRTGTAAADRSGAMDGVIKLRHLVTPGVSPSCSEADTSLRGTCCET